MRSVLTWYRYRQVRAEVEVVTHALEVAGYELEGWEAAVQEWSTASAVGAKKSVRLRHDTLAKWVGHGPCSEFGVSTRSVLRSDLGSHPVFLNHRVGARGFVETPPPVSNSSIFEEVRKRLGQHQKEFGLALESGLVQLVSRHLPVLHGPYSKGHKRRKDLGELDLLLLTADGKGAVVVECKALALQLREWHGNYHSVLVSLQRSFLASQEQLLRFERNLAELGRVVLHDGDKKHVLNRPERLVRVSLSFENLGDLHRPGYGHALLSHFGHVRIGQDPSSTRFDQVAKLQDDVRDHLVAIAAAGGAPGVAEKRTTFLDLGLFYGLITRVRSTEALLEELLQAPERTRNITQVVVS
jgi:hypothetical protein